MSKEETLKKVEQEIISGSLGKARDRMHGLIATYPTDLKLRHKLGEIYSLLQFPEAAGRYWYLSEPKTEEIKQAQAYFEKRAGDDPWEILRRLKFKLKPEEIDDHYAREKITELWKAYKKRYGSYPEFGDKDPLEWTETLADKLIPGGCLAIIILILILAAIGLYAVIDKVF